jgi:hypothetical protein
MVRVRFKVFFLGLGRVGYVVPTTHERKSVFPFVQIHVSEKRELPEKISRTCIWPIQTINLSPLEHYFFQNNIFFREVLKGTIESILFLYFVFYCAFNII